MSGIVYAFPFRTDLDKAVKKTYLDTIFATNDNAAHQFDVQLFRGNAMAQLPEGTAVNGYFIRYSDNATVPLTGSVSGSTVSVTLTKACYNKPGQFALIIKAVTSGVVSTVFYGEGTVFISSTDTQVDEENIIPSLDDLLAQIATMEAGTQAANTAAGNANTAASNADAAAGNANTAASRAETAAAKIEGMTVSAQAADAADAVISDVGGVKHIAFSLPKGEPGTTPAITFQAATGAAGSDVILEQSGTAEAPVIRLTIPRGDTGSVDGIDYYEGTPAALGTASPGTANGVARGNHVHPMPSAKDVGAAEENHTHTTDDITGLSDALAQAGKVKTVNEIEPDENGNIDLGEIGGDALTSDPREGTDEDPELGSVPNHADTAGKAYDADKLGGVNASDYALKTNTAPNSEKLGGVEPAGYVRHDELAVMVKTVTLEHQSDVSGGSNAQWTYTLDIPDGYTAYVLSIHIINTTNNAYGKVSFTFDFTSPTLKVSVFNSNESGVVKPNPKCTYMLVKEVG